MALYSGVTGKISIGGNDIVHLANWSVELTKDITEVVSFGNDYKEKIPSIKDWTASADGAADFEEDGGQKELHAAFESGAPLQSSFYLDETTFLSGTCYIESLSISHAADGSAEIDISLAGSGANLLTLPTP
ncbi:hypothetical protein GC105_09105 [Alkalibaculum sp. M08DMB]|uniref:Phage major tail protein, TP901-1 family n=1 Tax=Alkalibaculum sporogenes TaxID=2655001 RepID=A0A6A7K9T3_9FIRM|nr:phage tail tube protein [Alkalibaculum sporogenes]MPW25947.1 hypothetical protein [Alkalibaculum sporogenes]